MPAPSTRQRPRSIRSTLAPSARQARLVRTTSSPSSRPSIIVSPTVSSPRINARCEIDLSPGGRKRPPNGPLRQAVSGEMLPWTAA